MALFALIAHSQLVVRKFWVDFGDSYSSSSLEWIRFIDQCCLSSYSDREQHDTNIGNWTFRSSEKLFRCATFALCTSSGPVAPSKGVCVRQTLVSLLLGACLKECISSCGLGVICSSQTSLSSVPFNALRFASWTSFEVLLHAAVVGACICLTPDNRARQGSHVRSICTVSTSLMGLVEHHTFTFNLPFAWTVRVAIIKTAQIKHDAADQHCAPR